MIPLAFYHGQTEHLSTLRRSLDEDDLYIPVHLPKDCGERATVEILESIAAAVERVEL